MADIDQARTIAVIVHALNTPKLFVLALMLVGCMLGTSWFAAFVWKIAKDDLTAIRKISAQNEQQLNIEILSERERRTKIIESTVDSGNIDIFSTELVEVEDNGNLSIVAKMNTFGRYGKVEPTVTLSKKDVEVFRTLFIGEFDEKQPVPKHEVISVTPLDKKTKSAVLIIVVKHEELFHGSQTNIRQLIAYITNIRQTFSKLVGANIDWGIYVAVAGNPQLRYFRRTQDRFLFAPEDVDMLPLTELLEDAHKHSHTKHGEDASIRSHIEYLLKRARSLNKYDDRFVAYFSTSHNPAPDLKREKGFSNFVQFYQPKESTAPSVPPDEFQQHGLLQFYRGLWKAAKESNISSDLRAWAGQYAPGYQVEYKIQWAVDDFDPATNGRFFLRFNYLHFDQPQAATVSVLYRGKS